ncbi:MAG: arsenosugar biosynthesis radical SAM (seleno)protein ArsS [Candidatus Eisenbacteria bacterium]
MNAFEDRLARVGAEGLHASDIEVIQANLGLKCNQECVHCHVNAGPRRDEMMSWPVMERIIDVAGKVKPRLVDLTGGSPELNNHFIQFVRALRMDGHTVQVRTNLTVLLEPGLEAIPEFLKESSVQLVGSMPCYLEENVCAQRGEGAYTKSISAIKLLNALGYGVEPGLVLNLVYNPAGPVLPPDQADLEADYRRELGERFGIVFSNLLTIANMPIGRFGGMLKEQGQLDRYVELLRESFNPGTVKGLMCRHQLSIGWDGRLFDCDFNLALGLAIDHGAPDHIEHFNLPGLAQRRVVTGDHCFGCTAGQGSSCGGALA